MTMAVSFAIGKKICPDKFVFNQMQLQNVSRQTLLQRTLTYWVHRVAVVTTMCGFSWIMYLDAAANT